MNLLCIVLVLLALAAVVLAVNLLDKKHTATPADQEQLDAEMQIFL